MHHRMKQVTKRVLSAVCALAMVLTGILADVGPMAQVKAAAEHTVWIVGDSTVCTYIKSDGSHEDGATYYPRYGYGTQLANYLDGTYDVQNLALSGRSSLSFLSEANYTTLFGENGIKAGDALIVGFGHNDEKYEDSTRYTNPNGDWQTEGSFAKCLYDNYVVPAQTKGAEVILCTPIVRRGTADTLKDNEKHITSTTTTPPGGDYPAAIRKLGQDKNIAVADLTAKTLALYEELKADETIYLHAWSNSKPTSVDNTHLNEYGAKKVAYILASEIQNSTATLNLKSHISLTAGEPTKAKDLKVNPDYVESTYEGVTTPSTLWEDYEVTCSQDGTDDGTDDGADKGKVNKTFVFMGTAFGDLGGVPTTDNYTIGKDTNGDMLIEVKNNKGKIASASDGIAMYYYPVPVGRKFTLSAKATVQSVGTSNPNQIAFGLMARDDMYIDTNDKSIQSDYVVAGTYGDGGSNCFYRRGGKLSGKVALTTEEKPAAGKSYDLKISYNGDGYTCTFGNEPAQSGGFDFQLTSVDSDYVYVGMFAARNMKVTFSNIDFQVESAPEYKLTVTADENGTATASTRKAGIEEGEKITLIATPNEGYVFKEWQVVKGGVTITANKFTMPAADVEVKAIFEKDENAGGEEGTHTGDGTHDGTHSGGTHEGGKTHFSATNDGVENGALEAWFSDDPEFDIVEWNAETNRFEHVYTGDKITPAIVVWNGSRILTESVDYTVKYANNVKVAKNGKPATVTITGKGNYSGKQVLEFYVVPKNLADDDIIVGSTVTATNTKANPVVLYNGMKLTGKDYTISNTAKLSADTEIDIVAKEGGNYTGKIEGVTIKVVDKSALKKLKAALAKGVSKTYNGEEQTLEVGKELLITDAKAKTAIDDENLYAVSYGNNKKAGTAKVTVVGLDEYTGSVTKKFKIQPNKAVSLTYELGSVDGEDAESGYSFRKSGVTPKVYVTVNDSNSPLDGTALIQGVDYKVSYKSNKKVGSAGYTVTFLGNYKGHAAQKASFNIVAADITDAEVYVFDMPFNAKKTKGSAYMQKPFVVVNGELLAKSDYTLTYSIDKKAAVTAGTEVTVKVEGKKNYTKSTEATYSVIESSAIDISKAKVTVQAKNKTIGYTGAAIEFDPSDDERQGELNVKVGKAASYTGSAAVYNAFDVIYLNNVKKGKATVIVVGNGTDCVGFRAGTFKIGATNIKEKMKKQVDPDTVKELLKQLFGL